MNGSSYFNRVANWVHTWDYMAILYSLVAAIIFAVLLGWRRPFRLLSRLWRNAMAHRRYSRALTEECSNLIVVGKRQGFSMSQVFVPLDVVISDLMRVPAEEQRRSRMDSNLARTCVLLGGPGAGKSTLVKRRILDELAGRRRRSKPFFLRLRDYVGFDSIEDALAHELGKNGFVTPEKLLQDMLQMPGACVLDGLDEVKPGNRAKVIDDINVFFHKYFAKRGALLVTCRREAYLDTPLDIPTILEVRPLRDEQIQAFAAKWSLGFPKDKSPDTFWRDLTATPRIHELARSPLLLIGGLMQYTESNAGVPDERYKYLERVASWLISDWATAQGHPPDHFRPLYDRILPKLAYEMQRRNTSELPIAEAEKMIGRWLPAFGFPPDQVKDVITSMRTRTGILVANDKNNIIFAQFGLQEYFASLEMNIALDPSALAQLQPRTWWRESILIAVAQQRHPDPHLNALFGVDPVLGAAAVAECPTPALEQQAKAVTLCLREVDATNDAIKTPVVQLLRKLTGNTADELVGQLEKRLGGRAKESKFVGLLLATAGTEAANNALSRHPEVWATCLTDAGYLSDSFEGLLFSWVLQGDDNQCAKATDALFENLQLRNLLRLLDLLPQLTEEKADYIAQRVLSFTIKSVSPAGLRTVPSIGPLTVNCAPYVRKPDRFLEKHVVEARDGETDAASAHVREISEGPLLCIAALFQMCKRIGSSAPSRKAETIMTWLSRSSEWCDSHALFFCFYATTLSLFSTNLSHHIWRTALAAGCLLLGLFALCSRRPKGIWMMAEHSGSRTVTFASGTMFGLSCIGLTIVVIGPLIGTATLSYAVPIVFYFLGLILTRTGGRPFWMPMEYERLLLMHEFRTTGRMRHPEYAMHMVAEGHFGRMRSRLLKGRFLFCAAILLILAALSGFFLAPESSRNIVWIAAAVLFVSTLTGHVAAIWGHWISRRAQTHAERLLRKMLRELGANKVLHRIAGSRAPAASSAR